MFLSLPCKRLFTLLKALLLPHSSIGKLSWRVICDWNIIILSIAMLSELQWWPDSKLCMRISHHISSSLKWSKQFPRTLTQLTGVIERMRQDLRLFNVLSFTTNRSTWTLWMYVCMCRAVPPVSDSVLSQKCEIYNISIKWTVYNLKPTKSCQRHRPDKPH